MRLFTILMTLFYMTIVAATDIAVVTLSVGKEYNEAVSLGIENKRRYCEKHGYDFIVGTEHIDQSRPIAWSKILLVQKVMENPKYKWIFWTDADSIIMNLAIPVTDLIDEKYNFIVASDYTIMCTGQFLLRNCEWSKVFLKDVYSHIHSINHPWWEQRAIIDEYKAKHSVSSVTKILPQRMFNSYCPELLFGMPHWESKSLKTTLYKRGDFILHFCFSRNAKEIKSLFEKYYPLVVDELPIKSLDRHLEFNGFDLATIRLKMKKNYFSDGQKGDFANILSSYSRIKNVAEIGLTRGFITEFLFDKCKNLKKFFAFALEKRKIIKFASEYCLDEYKGRYNVVEGEFVTTIPQYVENNSKTKFDLIFIDEIQGNSTLDKYIVQGKLLAHSNTVLWINNYDDPVVKKAISSCKEDGVIESVVVHTSKNPSEKWSWAEIKYRF